MATIRVHEDQENRMAEVRRGKENIQSRDHHQGQGIQQQKRAVLGVLHSNCHRSKPADLKEVQGKDDKFPKAKPYLPTQFEPFKIYEEKKDDKPPLFKIYEEKLDEKKSVALRETRETHVKHVLTDINIKCDRTEKPILEVNPVSIVPTFRPALQDIVNLNKKEEAGFNHGSPMSLDKSLAIYTSEKKDIRSKLASLEGKQAPSFSNNSFYDVDEYRADIHNYLRKAEKQHRPKPGYMKKQPDITYAMRSILVDWLVEVAEEYRLHGETLYLAVSYIDRFLSYMSVVRAKLQLVGTAAMFIAAKYEEIYPPDIGEFVYITDDTYTRRQVLRMEHLILRVLAFDLTVPTPLSFLKDYCISNNLSEKILYLAMYLCELSMLEADPYLQYLPSHLAASAIAVARHTLQEEAWPHELELSTGYSLNELRKCINYLTETFTNAPNYPQQAIQEKYKNSKYGHVALLLPRSADTILYEEDSESA